MIGKYNVRLTVPRHYQVMHCTKTFFGFMGICFLAIGVSDNSQRAPFLGLMGGAFFVFAIVLLFINRQACCKPEQT